MADATGPARAKAGNFGTVRRSGGRDPPRWRGMVLGCGHPMGPLRLSDLIGLDTVRAIAGSMHEEFKEPQYAAPSLLLRMVDAGLLGKKTGRAFYDYTELARGARSRYSSGRSGLDDQVREGMQAMEPGDRRPPGCPVCAR
jgi:3-hydroxyacyl-CoA dehydrogenase